MPDLTAMIEDAVAGRTGAWADLVARFTPPALRLARSLLSSASLAEDAVQDAFVLATSRLGSLREPEAFPAWFRQVVRTAAARIARRRDERPLTEGRDPAGGGAGPSEAAERREIAALVRAAVAALPPTGRGAVELFYLHQQRVSEVASALGVPEGTVRRRLFDARARLATLWIGNPGAWGDTAKEHER